MSQTQVNNSARQILFRADSRPPATVFTSGFTARRPGRTNQTLEDYVTTNNSGPFVSTSESEWVPLMFIHDQGWVYWIRTSAPRATTLEQLGPNEFGHQREVAVLRSIPPEDIQCACEFRRVDVVQSPRPGRDQKTDSLLLRMTRPFVPGETLVPGFHRGRVIANPNFRRS